MRKWMWLVGLLMLLSSFAAFSAEKAIILDISGSIGPATQDYIQRGISYAEQEQAAAVILQLNTPGGLESAMRGINEAIIKSKVPVIAYVYPSGARAASAGVFIMYASHFTAMASATNAGAASPVTLFSSKPANSNTLSSEEKKAVNDASAYIRSLAELRNRNANWAELAVKQADSISATEAKKLSVIDEIADDYPQLLQKLDGRTIYGTSQKINTKHLQLEHVAPDWRYQFLAFITNPNIAYILLLLAFYGLFFELSNPGMIAPGIIGVMSLLIVLYAFQLMPINYTGLALIVLGIACMIFEVYVSSFGIVGIGGVIAFLIGSVMLFDLHDAHYQLAWSLILIMSTLSVIFFLIVIHLAVKSQNMAIVTGKEGLIDSEGVVINVTNGKMIVRVLGEIWEANSSHLLNAGDRIKVINVQGLKLQVEPLENHKIKQ